MFGKRKQATDLPLLSEVKKLSVNEGDVVVLMHPESLRAEQVKRITEHIKPVFPDNKVIVLEEGMDISVVGTGDLDAALAENAIALAQHRQAVEALNGELGRQSLIAAKAAGGSIGSIGRF